MKNIILFLASLLLMSGCAEFTGNTPMGAVNLENGNKIYAYDDTDPDGEHTTIIIARIDGDQAGENLVDIMEYIKDIFIGAENPKD